MEIPKNAIEICLKSREKAILLPKHSTKVGACLYVNGIFYDGFNIQNRSHKSYHAEEIAILKYLTDLDYPNNVSHSPVPTGMVVSFTDQITRITFCCGHCRQMIWETFKNPNFLVTEVDMEGNIVASKTIKELYPDPYPR